MRTNVMIRVDDKTVQSARSLDLNISKICEQALKRAVHEKTRPFEIFESREIVYNAQLFYYKNQKALELQFCILNALEETVIFDRLTYKVFIHSSKRSGISDPPLLQFEGVILDRKNIRRGEGHGVQKILARDLELPNDEPLSGRIFPQFYVNSKRGIIKAEFQEELDEKGVPKALPLNKLDM